MVQYVLSDCVTLAVDLGKHQLGRFGKYCSLLFHAIAILNYRARSNIFLPTISGDLFISMDSLACRKSTKIRKIAHRIDLERKFFSLVHVYFVNHVKIHLSVLGIKFIGLFWLDKLKIINRR